MTPPTSYYRWARLVVAAVLSCAGWLGLSAYPVQAAGVASVDGSKISTTGVGTGSFGGAAVSVRRVVTGATAFSVTNPFAFDNSLVISGASEVYVVTVAPVSVAGYTLKGSTWQADGAAYDPLTTHFLAGDTLTLSLQPGEHIKMNWLFQPNVVATPTATPVPTTAAAPTPTPTPAPTPTAAVSSVLSGNNVYQSDDGIVYAALPASMLDPTGTCSVTVATAPVAGNATIVVGPYVLGCLDGAGNALSVPPAAIRWTYHLRGKVGSGARPSGVVIDGKGNQTSATGSSYDASASELTFTTATFAQTAVVVAKGFVFPWGILVSAVLGLLVLGGVFAFIGHRSQKRSYDEYLRGKYYNL